jgi:hypothetical protein
MNPKGNKRKKSGKPEELGKGGKIVQGRKLKQFSVIFL